ncbi:hypothetical protein XAXN_08935 [Xanthomonas axonopodis]|uniref:Uncharacterized protein n=1 Tax=Xanthomonas axonopodis TaxID=53413 RepID=A0A0P6VBN2_9XANT|nr:hypothetical protein XAXN_08935 [Xanthomonas axonopodis]
MRIGKPHVQVQPLHQLGITGHFGAAIIGQARSHRGGQFLHLAGESFQGICGRAAVHTAQHEKARLALHQGAHAGTIEPTLDQTAFPMAWNQALLHLLGAGHDPQFLRHPGAFGRARSPHSTRRLALAQRLDKLLFQASARMRVDRCVDGLVTDALGRIVRMHGQHAWQQAAGATTATQDDRAPAGITAFRG